MACCAATGWRWARSISSASSAATPGRRKADGARGEAAVDQLDPARRRLAVGLAALAGFVDATGFLASGRYFASFMSGNTTRLGVDLAADPAAAAVPFGIIAGFVAGVVLGAVIAERGGARRKTAVLALVAALLLVAAIVAARWGGGYALAPAVLAMGALNNAFRRQGEVALGVTYMTGALVRLGQGIAARLLRRPAQGRLSAGALWLGLATGATGGALVHGAAATLSWPLAVAGALVLTLAAWRIEAAGDQPATR